jgi:hypothetical protein
MPFDPKIYHTPKNTLGGPEDSAATNVTDAWTIVALLKGMLSALGGAAPTLATSANQTTIIADLVTLLTEIGALTETAPGTDTASAGLNGRLQRIAQNITALAAGNASIITELTALVASNASVIAALGTLASDSGGTSENPPPGDTTAGYGLNARLQRVNQRLTEIIDRIPPAIGPHTAPNSLSVTLATDDQQVMDLQSALDRISQLLGGDSLSTFRLLSAANTTNATIIKTGPARFYSIQGYNAAASARYVKLYDLARAPVVGTDTPRKTWAIPPLAAFVIEYPGARFYSFANGLAFALTTGVADTDTGALTAADIVALNLDFA